MSRALDLYARILEEGEAAIEAFIRDRQVEQFFLDFKRSADDGAGTRLHDRDVNNLRKAISGFGNSEGGVIVWGVDCPSKPDGDFARDRKPLADVTRFVSLLQRASSGATIPAHPTVEHGAVVAADGKTGFAVTLIPRCALAPLQAVETLQYHMRAGGEFLPVPHAVLRGMFGHPDPPIVEHRWTVHEPRAWRRDRQAGPDECVTLRAELILRSLGPGIARDVFVSVSAQSQDGDNDEPTEIIGGDVWSPSKVYKGQISLVTVDEFKLAPDGLIRPVALRLVVKPDRRAVDFSYRITYGFQGGATQAVEYTAAAATIESARIALLRDRARETAEQAYADCFGIGRATLLRWEGASRSDA